MGLSLIHIWMCKAYLILMLVTFGELFISLLLLRVENALLVSAVIALADMLPLIGTGGIMVPWVILELSLIHICCRRQKAAATTAIVWPSAGKDIPFFQEKLPSREKKRLPIIICLYFFHNLPAGCGIITAEQLLYSLWPERCVRFRSLPLQWPIIQFMTAISFAKASDPFSVLTSASMGSFIDKC